MDGPESLASESSYEGLWRSTTVPAKDMNLPGRFSRTFPIAPLKGDLDPGRRKWLLGCGSCGLFR